MFGEERELSPDEVEEVKQKRLAYVIQQLALYAPFFRSEYEKYRGTPGWSFKVEGVVFMLLSIYFVRYSLREGTDTKPLFADLFDHSITYGHVEIVSIGTDIQLRKYRTGVALNNTPVFKEEDFAILIEQCRKVFTRYKEESRAVYDRLQQILATVRDRYMREEEKRTLLGAGEELSTMLKLASMEASEIEEQYMGGRQRARSRRRSSKRRTSKRRSRRRKNSRSA